MEKEKMKNQIKFAKLEQVALSEKDKKTLIKFLLLFNVFEARLFENGQHVNDLLKQISADVAKEPWFDIALCDSFLTFFIKRYINDNGKTNNRFDQLRLTGHADNMTSPKGNAKAVLLGKELKQENILFACLCISYRFRNNLFHGSKDVLGLNAYYDCFEIIIEFITSLLEMMIENDFYGLNTKYKKT